MTILRVLSFPLPRRLDEPTPVGSQFSPVWPGTSTVIIFTTGCVIVCNSDELYKLTFPLRARRVWAPVARPHHGNFSPSMLNFLEQRYRNVRSPNAAVEKCAVTTGLLVLLKATGHGKDLLAEVCEIDTYDWDDHGRLPRKLDKP